MIKRLRHKIKMCSQKRKQGWCDEDTYELNTHQIKMINNKYKRYLELADKIVDLDYFKYNINGEIVTQKQAIKKIIQLSNVYLTKYADGYYPNVEEYDIETYDKETNEVLDELFAYMRAVFLDMWW